MFSLEDRSKLAEIDLNNLLIFDKAPIDTLPREKPIPGPKKLTKWEAFARTKGIKKKKKLGKVWDEETQSWKRTWGRDRIDDVKSKWVIEVPQNRDPYEDQFQRLRQERKDNKDKNEINRLKNIARAMKGDRKGQRLLPDNINHKNTITRAQEISAISDASMGKFSTPVNVNKINKNTEKKAKAKKVKALARKKGVRAPKKGKGKKKNSV